jgi:nicotinamide-nucleotide amidase
MKAEIVATGSELALGEIIDTNSAYLARNLTSMGIEVLRTTVVGDSEQIIYEAVSQALSRVDLVICTGGLGPTVDDRTREAVARATGRPLEFHQHLLDQIAERFASFGRTMSPSNRQQAFVPEGARIVENPRGTAPSFIVEKEEGTVVVLPGVPSEMRFLWETAIQPYLRNDRGETGMILVRTLHAAGTSESAIGEAIADLMDQENPNLGISAKRGQFEIRIVAQSDSPEGAAALADEAVAIVHERIGQYILGDESLSQQVLRLLTERNLSVALAEGGERAATYRQFSDTPKGRAVLKGVQLNPHATYAQVDELLAAAKRDAIAVREQWGSSLGVAVYPIAAPEADGFSTVAMAIAHADGVFEAQRRYDLNLDDAWEFIGTLAFEGLRRFLLES